jgi:hypothetical protein
MVLPPLLEELELLLELLDEDELELEEELLLDDDEELLELDELLEDELLELELLDEPPLPEQVGSSKLPSCVPCKPNEAL